MSYDHAVRGTAKRLAVSTDGISFTSVSGVQQAAFTDTATTADNSDLNSGYYGGGDVPVAGRVNGTATLLRRHDQTAYDPGQEIIRQAAETQQLIYVRWWDTSFAGAEAKQAPTFVQWAAQPTSRTALETVNVTFNVQGGPSDIVNPGDTATSGEPVITSIAPTGQSVGDQLAIHGNGFTGATDVDFGLTAATDFLVVSDNLVVVVVPSGASGAVDVTVTNATGESDAMSYTVV